MVDSAARRSKRDLLLESALELFAEHGYAGTSVRAIAQRAGVSQGLLYVHFENKAAVSSMGQRNSIVEHVRWGEKVERFAGSLVELEGNFI